METSNTKYILRLKIMLTYYDISNREETTPPPPSERHKVSSSGLRQRAVSLVFAYVSKETACSVTYAFCKGAASFFDMLTILDCMEVKSGSIRSTFRAVNLADLTYERRLPQQQQTKHISLWFGILITYIVFRGHVSEL